MIPLFLTRWKVPLGICGALAFLGLALAANHYRHAYHAEKALRQADHAAYVSAQAEATLIAREALRRQEHIYVTKAQEADNEYVAKLADAHSRTGAYIDRMRVKAPSRDASATPSSAEGYGSASPDRSSAAPDMVAVTEADIQVCTVNTQRLDAAHNWALSLQSGL